MHLPAVTPPKTKDTWDKLDVLAKIALGVAGILFTTTFDCRQQNADVTRLAATMLTQREDADINFRQRMFADALEKLTLRSNSLENLDARLTTLRLMQDNFQDVFNGRTFFYAMEREAGKYGARGDTMVEELVGMARQASETQESIILASGGHYREADKLKPWAEDTLAIHETDTLTVAWPPEGWWDVRHGHEILVTLESLGRNAARVSGSLEDRPFNRGESFELSFFDTPFTDNFLLEDGHRVALILKDVTPDSAMIRAIEFPADFILSGYRPSLRAMRNLMKTPAAPCGGSLH